MRKKGQRLRKSVHAFLVLFTFALSAVAYAGTVKTEGSLPRDLTQNTFNITVTVTGLSEVQKQAVEALQDNYTNNPQIFLNQNTQSIPFSANGAQPSSTPLPDAYFTVQTPSESIQEDNGNWTYKFYLTINALNQTLTQLVGSTKEIKVGVLLLGGSNEEYANSKTTPDIIKQDSFVIAAAPLFQQTPAVGTHTMLNIYWENKGAVKAKLETGAESEREPTNISVFLVDLKTTGAISLPARTFAPTQQSGDPQSSCSFEPEVAAASGQCVKCPDDTYLDLTEIKKIGIRVSTKKVKDVSTTFSGLENGQTYAVFMQYEPNGLQRSQCITASPSANLSLTELNGEGKATTVDFRCFIATAAYGSPLHEDLAIFRRFRDEQILTRPFGQPLVELYYRMSPPLARWIDEHPAVRPYVQTPLTWLANLLR